MPSTGVDFAIQLGDADLVGPWAEVMDDVYRRLSPFKEAYADGLVPMCVELCRLLGPVEIQVDSDQGGQRVIGKANLTPHFS